MSVPAQALALEAQHLGAGGKPTLGAAFELCLDAWRAGERDRELGLHLMFLAWYLTIEPPFLTGLDEQRTPSKELSGLFLEVHRFFEELVFADAELLYVLSVMAGICPWCIDRDDVSTWDQRASEYDAAHRALAPNGLSAELFEGRGFYGHYFAGMLRSRRRR